jgi:hypothetical protein
MTARFKRFLKKLKKNNNKIKVNKLMRQYLDDLVVVKTVNRVKKLITGTYYMKAVMWKKSYVMWKNPYYMVEEILP